VLKIPIQHDEKDIENYNLKKQVVELESELAEKSTIIATNEADILNTMLALTEVYELLLMGG
jgi:3-hydroxyacyl-CoA dehydrogenase